MKPSQLMRVLLDENFPADFAQLLVGPEVYTVHSLGWSGVKNGDLLRRARDVCDVFVTLDRSLEFQQNIKVLPFGIVVLRATSNRVADLTPHIISILDAASRVEPGSVERAGI
jgi:predicted nuclease of predicted toxin-antitoxin system